MAFSVLGTGTLCYGERNHRHDGSYITTEWIAVLFVPLIPIASARIRNVQQLTNVYFYASTRNEVLEQRRLCWPQIACTYAMAVSFLAAFFYLNGYTQTHHIDAPLPMAAFALFLVPPALHALSRRRGGMTTKDSTHVPFFETRRSRSTGTGPRPVGLDNATLHELAEQKRRERRAMPFYQRPNQKTALIFAAIALLIVVIALTA